MAAMLKVQNNKDLNKNKIYFLTSRKIVSLFCISSMAAMKTLYKPAIFQLQTDNLLYLEIKKDFELYYLSLTKQQIHLELRDILIGVLTPECPLLNYLLLIGKIYLWGCRRNNELPNIGGYKFKVSLKYDTEKFICTKNNTLDIFKKKWTILRPI